LSKILISDFFGKIKYRKNSKKKSKILFHNFYKIFFEIKKLEKKTYIFIKK